MNFKRHPMASLVYPRWKSTVLQFGFRKPVCIFLCANSKNWQPSHSIWRYPMIRFIFWIAAGAKKPFWVNNLDNNMMTIRRHTEKHVCAFECLEGWGDCWPRRTSRRGCRNFLLVHPPWIELIRRDTFVLLVSSTWDTGVERLFFCYLLMCVVRGGGGATKRSKSYSLLFCPFSLSVWRESRKRCFLDDDDGIFCVWFLFRRCDKDAFWSFWPVALPWLPFRRLLWRPPWTWRNTRDTQMH